MTLGDFLKRIDIEKDKDKMMLLYDLDEIGWTNLKIKVTDTEIKVIPDVDLIFSSDK